MNQTTLTFTGLLILAVSLFLPRVRGEEVGYRVELTSPQADSHTDEQGLRTVRISAPEGTNRVRVDVEVILSAQLEPCYSGSPLCSGEENTVTLDGEEIIYGCFNLRDDDGDGLTDLDDPDCRGVVGWSMSVETDPGFGIQSATTSGTAADLDTRPPGRRDSRSSSFEKTDLVDPSRDCNEGREGATTAALLSYFNPVFLPSVGEAPVLKLSGLIETRGLLEGESTEPNHVTIIPRFGALLCGTANPVQTMITVDGLSLTPQITNLAVVVDIVENTGGFQRPADCDQNGRLELTDGICLLGFLFRGNSAMLPCGDGTITSPGNVTLMDTDGNRRIELTDAVRIFQYLFSGGNAPSLCTSANCLDCASIEGCPDNAVRCP